MYLPWPEMCVFSIHNKVQEVPCSYYCSWNHRWRTGLSPLSPPSMRLVTHFGYVTYCPIHVLTHIAVARFQFQLTTMASLARFYKKKYLQYRPLYERLKEEHAEAKRLRQYSFNLCAVFVSISLNLAIRLVDDLRSENQDLKQQLQGLSGGRGDNFSSGKRRRIDGEK